LAFALFVAAHSLEGVETDTVERGKMAKWFSMLALALLLCHCPIQYTPQPHTWASYRHLSVPSHYCPPLDPTSLSFHKLSQAHLSRSLARGSLSLLYSTSRPGQVLELFYLPSTNELPSPGAKTMWARCSTLGGGSQSSTVTLTTGPSYPHGLELSLYVKERSIAQSQLDVVG